MLRSVPFEIVRNVFVLAGSEFYFLVLVRAGPGFLIFLVRFRSGPGSRLVPVRGSQTELMGPNRSISDFDSKDRLVREYLVDLVRKFLVQANGISNWTRKLDR